MTLLRFDCVDRLNSKNGFKVYLTHLLVGRQISTKPNLKVKRDNLKLRQLGQVWNCAIHIHLVSRYENDQFKQVTKFGGPEVGVGFIQIFHPIDKIWSFNCMFINKIIIYQLLKIIYFLKFENQFNSLQA